MPIIFHKSSQVFHLYNDHISYIFQILENGQLGQLYYGKKLTDRKDFNHLFEGSTRDMAPYSIEGNSQFSLEHIKQEYPTFGNGDMRYPAYQIERENGSKIVEFSYHSHKIYSGKPKLKGLPATYVEEKGEGTTLEILLKEPYLSMSMILIYTIFEQEPAIARSTKFRNNSKKSQTLLCAMSGCVDLPDCNYEMMELAGAWGRERSIRFRTLDYGVQSVYSMRGSSSHQFNPFLALKRKNTDEFSGEVLGFSLVYSGSFKAQVEVDNYDVSRVLMGIHPDEFKWELEEGESFQTPEMVMVYSDSGLNKMSQTFHRLYRTRLARGTWRDKERPILMNNWEATYFDFDGDKIYDLAKRAKQLGIELFVLDDGWFGGRNSDNSSLGDWYPNEEKLGGSLEKLASKIINLGMDFGLWIEPEMVNEDSDLYRSHPDWVLAEVGRNRCHSRNQYVLDFSRTEVRDYIYEKLENILCHVPITYIKWDMNRTISDAFSNGKSKREQGKIYHKYILGVYELYERFLSNFPEILFESCASGGARFDPGMMYYAPQAWTSDNTDAIHRLKIQYGTSVVYPISSMGSHVSAQVNHQTGRSVSLETRGNVSYFGTFGYELDLTALEKEELEGMKAQILFMKKYRRLIQKGNFYRLLSPFEGNEVAWMVVNEEQSEGIVGYYQVLQPVNVGFKRLKLQGISLRKEYKVTSIDLYKDDSRVMFFYGDELMQSGLILSDYASGVREKGQKNRGDFISRLYHIELKKAEGKNNSN